MPGFGEVLCISRAQLLYSLTCYCFNEEQIVGTVFLSIYIKHTGWIHTVISSCCSGTSLQFSCVYSSSWIEIVIANTWKENITIFSLFTLLRVSEYIICEVKSSKSRFTRNVRFLEENMAPHWPLIRCVGTFRRLGYSHDSAEPIHEGIPMVHRMFRMARALYFAANLCGRHSSRVPL